MSGKRKRTKEPKSNVRRLQDQSEQAHRRTSSSNDNGLSITPLGSLLLGDDDLDPSASDLFDPDIRIRAASRPHSLEQGPGSTDRKSRVESISHPKLPGTDATNGPVVLVDIPSKVQKHGIEKKPRHRTLKKLAKLATEDSALRRTRTRELTAEKDQEKARRTLFVGNVPLSCVKDSKQLGRLKAFLLQFTAEQGQEHSKIFIESLRFRSIAYSMPTEDTDSKTDAKKRKITDVDGSISGTSDLSGPEAKKLAFIKRDFHPSAGDRCNAYVVFKMQLSRTQTTEGKECSLEATTQVAESKPIEAHLASIIKEGNGAVFDDHALRMDWVVPPSGTSERHLIASAGRDAGRTVFVGSLDFAAREDDLRALFEDLLSKHLRSASVSTKARVEYVRIVRDKGTLMGKGFAYVMLQSRECVDALLALDAADVRLNKRKLRLERCKPKTLTRTKSSKVDGARKDFHMGRTDKAKAVEGIRDEKEVAKLAETLRALPKAERKALKASDPDRVARRLAKKSGKKESKPDRTGTKFSKIRKSK